MPQSHVVVHAESAGGNRPEDEPDSLTKHAEPPGRRSAVANAVLYGSINGIVAVPAMVSFVAIIFQARWRAFLHRPGVTPGHEAVGANGGNIYKLTVSRPALHHRHISRHAPSREEAHMLTLRWVGGNCRTLQA